MPRSRSLAVVVAAVVLGSGMVGISPAVAAPERPASQTRQWVATDRNAGGVTDTVVDAPLHRVFVVASGSVQGDDYAVTALNEAGRALWTTRVSLGSATPTGAVVDPVNHQVYVTGYVEATGSAPVSFATVAIDPTGTVVWTARWHGPEDSYAESVAVDPSTHQVYVAGGGGSLRGRAIVVAYSAGGAQLWVSQYTGNTRVSADAFRVAVDPVTHTVVAAGSSATATSTFGGPAAFALAGDTGRLLWADRIGTDNGYAYTVAVDPGSDHVYVAGARYTVAYDATGKRLWTRSFPGGGQWAQVDPGTHRLVVTGQGAVDPDGRRGFVTVAYDANGTIAWHRTFDGGGPTPIDDAYPFGLALDPTTHTVVITGASQPHGTPAAGSATIAYDLASGDRLWSDRYDRARPVSGAGVAIDPGRGVYIAASGHAGADAGWTAISY